MFNEIYGVFSLKYYTNIMIFLRRNTATKNQQHPPTDNDYDCTRHILEYYGKLLSRNAYVNMYLELQINDPYYLYTFLFYDYLII